MEVKMKDKNTLDLGTIDELEDRHDIPLAKVKKLMETRPIIREKGEEFTLLSIPMEIEFKALLDNLDVEFRRRVIEGIPGITFPSKSGNVFAFISKVGRTNTAFDLGIISRRLNVKRIINLGTAGSLSDNVHSFDVVIANNVAYYDVDLTAFDYTYGQMSGCPPYFRADPSFLKPLDSLKLPIRIHRGLILTADSFMTQNNVNQKILSNFDNPLCIDMEGAAVGQVAYRLGVPFIIIRSISDVVHQDGTVHAHENFALMSAKNGAKIALHLLNNQTN